MATTITIPDGAAHPVQWTTSFLQKKFGFKLSPNLQAGMIQGWQKYVDGVEAANAASEAKQDDAVAEAPTEASPRGGLAFGVDDETEEDND